MTHTGNFPLNSPDRFRICVAHSRWIFLLTLGLSTASAWGQCFPSAFVDVLPYASNPVFAGAGPGHWDVKIRERGWIIHEADGYHLWYSGYDGVKTSIKRLGYATSSDGIHWQRHGTGPLLADVWVEDMMVVKKDSTYHMFAEGKDDQAHLLTSTDRVHWSPQGRLDVRKANGTPIEPGPYGTPTAWFEDGVWRLFYERKDQAVWLATSADMKVWTNLRDEPVLSRGPELYDRYAVALNQIVKHNGRYYAFYHAADTPEWKHWSINVATSTDLVNWVKYPGNPILRENKSSGIVVCDGQRFRLYTMHDNVAVHFPRCEP